jgi:hypothetical protein
VRLGQDPVAHKELAREQSSETLEAVLKHYMIFKRKVVRPSSYIAIEYHLLEAFAPLHGLPIAGIDRRAVAKRLRELSDNTRSRGCEPGTCLPGCILQLGDAGGLGRDQPRHRDQ